MGALWSSTKTGANVTMDRKTDHFPQKLKFKLLLLVDTYIFADCNGSCDRLYCCWVINTNMNGLGKTLLWKKHVFRWSIIDVGVYVYSHQLSILWARKEQQEEVMLGCCC